MGLRLPSSFSGNIGFEFSLSCLYSTAKTPTFVEPAPAGDPGALTDHVPVLLWDADGDDVGLELDGLVKAKERQVVLERLRVELLVRDHDGDFPVLKKEYNIKMKAKLRLHGNTWWVDIYPEGYIYSRVL